MRGALEEHSISNPCSAATNYLTLFGNGRRAVLFPNSSPDQAMFVSGAPDRQGPSLSSREGAHPGTLIYRQEAT